MTDPDRSARENPPHESSAYDQPTPDPERAAAAGGTAAGAEDEAEYGQVLGRGTPVNRDAAEAGPGDPATGARRDADGNPIA
jgi:hypothetical protein